MGQGQGGPHVLKGWDRPSHGSCRQCVPIFMSLFNTEYSSDISDKTSVEQVLSSWHLKRLYLYISLQGILPDCPRMQWSAPPPLFHSQFPDAHQQQQSWGTTNLLPKVAIPRWRKGQAAEDPAKPRTELFQELNQSHFSIADFLWTATQGTTS